jgi:molybdopterin-biosynthesis enzyme MoeA-like protein
LAIANSRTANAPGDEQAGWPRAADRDGSESPLPISIPATIAPHPAKAFGVPIDSDPRALAILHEWVKTSGAEMNEARLRLTRIPKGAELILNKVSGAPGFWIGNVIVMAGVPSIMQAMLDEGAPKLKVGVRMLSETVRREGDISMQLGEIAKANPGVAIGSYPFFDPQHGPNTNVVLRAHDAKKLAQAKREVEEMLERVRRAQSKSA